MTFRVGNSVDPPKAVQLDCSSLIEYEDKCPSHGWHLQSSAAIGVKPWTTLVLSRLREHRCDMTGSTVLILMLE